MSEIDLLNGRVSRERAVRPQTESTLDDKALELFLANERLQHLSHEIRTPLNAIIGMSHLLFDTRPTPQQQEYIEILKTSADFLHSLVSDLLDITKIEAGRLEAHARRFDMAGLLRATQKVFEMKLQDRPIDIEVMLDTRIMGEYVGDEVMLTQILTNLVGNAEKFTDTGIIQIIAKIREETDTTSWIEFSVIDTGIGIPEEKLEWIFQKFRQVNAEDHKYKGTGLGLTICKELVEIQGGTISVESQMGQGSVFTFTLPFGKTTVLVNPPGPGEPIELSVDKLSVGRILVAEDNLMNQKYIGSLLAKWDVPYVMVTNGKQAVEEVKKQSFDLILMDTQMPIMDGYEATVAIRSSPNVNRHVPIIALTASVMLAHKNVALRAGMNDFLTKPFDPGQLLAMLHQYTSSDAREPGPETTFELDREQLADLYGSDKASASEIFRAFLTDVAPEFDTLSDLCSQGNWAELERLVHKLKPTLGMVGLSKLEEKMDHLERNVIKENKYEEINIYCIEIVKYVNEALPLLEKEIQGLS